MSSDVSDLLGRFRAAFDRPFTTIRAVAGGGNSRLFQLSSTNGDYAVKLFGPVGADGRDRFAVEFAALDFMRRHGVTAIPALHGGNDVLRAILLEWLPQPVAMPAGAPEVAQALQFLEQLHGLREAVDAEVLPPASEACLSGQEICRQIEVRLARLQQVSADGCEPALAEFLHDSFIPAFSAFQRLAKAELAEAGLAFSTPLPRTRQALIPADFGFHNARRRTERQLCFVDFEYFGWDDPVKLAADSVLHPHPAMTLPGNLKTALLSGLSHIHADDATFKLRLTATLPLFGLRWTAILLNEFVPEKWQIRAAATAASDWEAAKQRQLDKARQYIAELTNTLRILRHVAPT